MAQKRCKARRPDGQPCRAPALAGTDYCYWHDPHRRAARRDAARRGGTVATEKAWAADETALGERLAEARARMESIRAADTANFGDDLGV